MEELLTIEGMFKILIFQSDNFYTVAKFRLQNKEEKMLTVTGYLKEIMEDTMYRLQGRYIEHPRYGMQFEIIRYERIMPTDASSLVQFFSSSLFSGIGQKAAEKIVTQLGEEAISLLKEDPQIVNQIVGLSKKQRESLLAGVEGDVSIDDSVVFLTQHGMSLRNIMKVDSIYEDKAIEIIKENPYKMIEDIDGIGFKTADKIAMQLGFSMDHPHRLKAAVLSILNDMTMASGNTYVTYEMLRNAVFKEFTEMDEDTLLELLVALRQDRLIYQEEEDIYTIAQYDAEKGIAQFLSQFPYVEYDIADPALCLEKLEKLEEKFAITYEEKQKEAILQFFKEPFSIITGGPGTGKTTIVRAIIALYKELYPMHQIAVCAPTGRAAKRLGELSQMETSTIHSLLKWDLESNSFAVNENDPLQYSLLIIDEFSMVDSWLFYNVLKASHYVGKIVVIGDEDQLPSVGPGFVLKDLIASSCFSLSRLSKIFRQKEGSDIVALANEIKRGECEQLHHANDVKLFPCQNYQVKEQILKIVQNAIDKGYEFQDVQVLAPMYNGVAGIDALNKALQDLCNPPSIDKREVRVGYRTFREGDKILQLKNQPEDMVYNGDIGKLIAIEEEILRNERQYRIVVDYDGILVEYNKEQFQVITHAYCISIHKSQGSEYPIVIMPVLKDYIFMLQRRLLYTGITRAKKSLVLLGDEAMLKKGINTEEKYPRMTKLTARIQNLFE